MPATYEPIATVSVTVAAASITFSSIPSTYTDLRFVWVGTATSNGAEFYIRFNSDSGTNYSQTGIYGNGASAASGSVTSASQVKGTLGGGVSSTIPHFYTCDVFSYAGSTNKTCLIESSEDRNGSGFVERNVGLWRSTSAINTITILPNTLTWAAGTTATLYGIKSF